MSGMEGDFERSNLQKIEEQQPEKQEGGQKSWESDFVSTLMDLGYVYLGSSETPTKAIQKKFPGLSGEGDA